MLNPLKLLSVPNWVKMIPITGLWWLCSILDLIPTVQDGKLIFGCWGCVWGISTYAFKLEKKWNVYVDNLRLPRV
jgi:hypothetical protein